MNFSNAPWRASARREFLLPECENDEQVVGSMIGILHRKNVIHPGPEPRDRAIVWVFGKAPVEKHEPPISLAGGDFKRGPGAEEAARVIAGMRQTSTRTRAHATPSVQTPALTVRAKIEAALREHGPMRATDLAAHVDEKHLGNNCSTLANRGILIRLGGTKRGTFYGLPGQPLKVRNPLQVTTPAKGREPATLSRQANGGGGAATSAAGPAEQVDSLYAAALLDLKERRAALEQRMAAELAKFDRAIEAMGDLA